MKMNDEEKLTLDEYAEKIINEFEANVKNIIAKNASKSRGYMYLDHLINILGWQGGTIHQVLDEVRRLKAFDDSCKAYTNRWTDLADILNLPYYTPCGEVIKEVERLKIIADNLDKAISTLQEVRKGEVI
jgi:arginine deiminase